MTPISPTDVSTYVEENISTFHQKRIASLDSLSLEKVLKRKNPYLFKAKFVLTAEEIVRGLVDAHISSNEETIFGDWLEGLAIFINGKVYGGWKSGITAIDLEFDNNGIRYKKNEEFHRSYAQMLNKFTRQFGNQYCDSNGAIEWKKLVQFNSSKR